MKRIGVLLILVILIISTRNVCAADDDHSNLFAGATEIALNSTLEGQFSTDYDVDSFSFIAPESGYYSFFGSGGAELRGHLYNSSYQYMYSGDTFRDKQDFFIVAYLQKDEKVYLKVDSTVRMPQSYQISAVSEVLPFDRIIPSMSSVFTYVYDGELKTVKIPIRFYSNGRRLSYISKAYVYLMNISAQGLIRGQAVFNTESLELELDIYGETDSVLTVNLGPDISTKITVRAEYQEKQEEPAIIIVDPPDIIEPHQPEPVSPDPNPNYPRPTKQFRMGDCNLDNQVDLIDVATLLDANALSQFSQQQFQLADVTGNGIVDLTDAVMLLRRVTGSGR